MLREFPERVWRNGSKSKLRDDCTEEEHALNRRSEFMITK
jgi:hypothetical protein